MKIIIDISDEDYEYIKNSNDMNFNAIKNGTPLPKNHGRLIDADVIDDNIYELTRSLDLDYSQIINVVDNAPTIIEAESEE